MTTHSPQEMSVDFDRVLRDTVEKRRLMPLIRAALKNGFADFKIHVPGYSGPRPHDGWWHPSTHGLWEQRKLFLYLARPDMIDEEDFDVVSIEAVTVGHFWHVFYQTLLQQCTNVLPQAEVSLENPKYRLRGHADGELIDDGDWGKELLEIKTINEFQFPKLTSNRQVRELKPGYYNQAQDYLAMYFGEYGVGTMRFLVVYPGVPFPKNEFTVKANGWHQEQRFATYKAAWTQVQEYRAGGHVQLTEACCMPSSAMAKTCPVRIGCPVGRNV